MSWPADQSPSKYKNSPQRPGQFSNFRSPFPSPRNGHDFAAQSPRKTFGWRNNGGHNRFQNDRFHYSPGGNRRGGGGHFRGRGGGHFRGSPSDSTDISLYVNLSMLSDPWKELEETLGTKLSSRISLKSETSVSSTPNSTISTSLNTSVSNDDTKENITEESVVISDDSSEDIVVTERTAHDVDQSAKTSFPDSSSYDLP